MGEATDGRLVPESEAPTRSAPSLPELKAAIRDTRGRLAVEVGRTADHVQRLFTAPSSSAESLAAPDGVASSLAKAVAMAGRVRRAWMHARQMGGLRRVAFGSVAVAMATIVTVRIRRRRRA